ncbi:hypothetical protein LINPERHAP1_LOCUS15619 [Linum perenne]
MNIPQVGQTSNTTMINKESHTVFKYQYMIKTKWIRVVLNSCCSTR